MIENIRPLPCPWCGGEAVQFYDDRRSWWRVVCMPSKCDVWGPKAELESEAIAAWNEVAALRARAEEAEARVAELERVHVEADAVRKERNRTAASVLGGEVEGAPTTEFNWIQRARELVKIEAALAERDERIAALEGELRLMATHLRGMKDSRLVRNSTLERFAVRLEALSPKEAAND